MGLLGYGSGSIHTASPPRSRSGEGRADMYDWRRAGGCSSFVCTTEAFRKQGWTAASSWVLLTNTMTPRLSVTQHLAFSFVPRKRHPPPPLFFIAWRRVPFMFLQTSVNQSLPFKTKLSHMQNDSCSSCYTYPWSRYSLLDELRHLCISCVRSLSLQLVKILAKN